MLRRGEVMTKLLNKAFQKAALLPDALQDQIARECLDEIKLLALLEARSKETGDIPLRKVGRKRGL
jgi:hypothetical protein